MEERNRSRPRGERPSRPPARSGPRPTGGPGRSRGPSQDDLLEIADELEEQGRALLKQARQLQRMASSMGGGGERSGPERGSRPSGGGEGRPERGPRSSGRGGEGRPRRRPDDADERGGGREPRPDKTPSWAPQGKRKRS